MAPSRNAAHAERVLVRSSAVRPRARAMNFQRWGAGSPISTANMRNTAYGPGAFSVLKTRMRKGTGTPTLYISASMTQARSQFGGSTNCTSPYSAVMTMPQSASFVITLRIRGNRRHSSARCRPKSIGAPQFSRSYDAAMNDC